MTKRDRTTKAELRDEIERLRHELFNVRRTLKDMTKSLRDSERRSDRAEKKTRALIDALTEFRVAESRLRVTLCDTYKDDDPVSPIEQALKGLSEWVGIADEKKETP